MSSGDLEWTEFFFRDYRPGFNFEELIRTPDQFRRFQCKRWRLGGSPSEDIPAGSPALVLWLHAWNGKSKTTYIAKTFSEYTTHQASTQLRRYFSRQHSVEEVQDQLDQFLAETRAFEHIDRFCSRSHRIFFPRYYGIMTDIDYTKYPFRYKLRRRAIVLEAIKPTLESRRVLAQEVSPETTSLVESFSRRLKELPLSRFEANWYQSLLGDRLRRITALHDIGITHGDIRDDHFRLPGDFYDTVLFDFSISYTFSSSWPYLTSFRDPQPLSVVKRHEQRHVEEQVLRRAKRMDLRDHIAESVQLSLEAIEKSFSQSLGNEERDLELIVVKVMSRPDAFTIPSLASIFPFLEALRPEDSPVWHISRARLLQHYVSAWILYTDRKEPSRNTTSLVSFSGEVLADVDELTMEPEHKFLLALIPRSWIVQRTCDKLLAVCAQAISSSKPGCVITKAEFGQN